MSIFTFQGLSGNMLLLFTLLIWLTFLLILLSNKHNRLNRWCFISGMCFSLGVLKEYLYFWLYPILTTHYHFSMSSDTAFAIYSCLTAILYYFSLPTTMIFGFYFQRFHEKHAKIFPYLCCVIFIIPLLIHLIYPYQETRFFQLNDSFYYIFVTIYNWFYGICLTFLLLNGLKNDDRHLESYHQKKLVAFVILIPIWYWLITVFLFHVFRFEHLLKAWQGNIIIIVFLLVIYIYNIFKDGIWGTRFHVYKETYDWSNQNQFIKNNASFINHLIKNEVSKINWCTSILKNQDQANDDVIHIIERSTQHLFHFVEKNNYYASDISIHKEYIPVRSLLQNCIQDKNKLAEDIDITLSCPQNAMLYCDKEHIYEVISNILDNSIEAISQQGSISVSFHEDKKSKTSQILIEDNGKGMSQEDLMHIFEPYHTTKSRDYHFGLGLYYCDRVMKKHQGKIKVKSQIQKGTSFMLIFPYKKYLKGSDAK